MNGTRELLDQINRRTDAFVRRLGASAPEVTEGTKSAKRWQQRTPAMAAGLTDRVWSLREVLMYRVPPWPQPQGG